jgi:hypothetical protein
MSWRSWTLIAVMLAAALVASAHRSTAPRSRGDSMREDCSSCHKGSAPRTHTRVFVEREHGPAARGNRRECLGCHERTAESCDPCHREQPPDWHSDDFRNPALGSVEMHEHIRIARNHREACSECHATSYMNRCVHCHRPAEEWLGRSGDPLHRATGPSRSSEPIR